MFFIFGITQGQEQLDFHQTMVCQFCGKYGQIEVFMAYTCLSLFFIPTFKWGRHYYARLSCCGRTVELDQNIGEGIRNGSITHLSEDIFRGQSCSASESSPSVIDVHEVNNGQKNQEQENSVAAKVCPHCGFTTTEDFQYCPKCGTKF